MKHRVEETPAMTTPPTTLRPGGVDPQLVQDLRLVESACRTFGGCRERLAPWEAFTLLKVGRDEFLTEIERIEGWIKTGMGAKVCAPVKDRLDQVRAEFGPLAGRLNRFLIETAPGTLEPDRQDLAVLFLMGSAKARQSVAGWLSDPAGSGADVALKLRILSKLVDGCLTAMREEPPTSAAPARAPETSIHRPKAASSRLKPALVDNLRLLDRCGSLLRSGDPEIGWDLFYLVITQGEEARQAILELEELKSRGKPGEFAGAFHRFRCRLKEIRDGHAGLIPPLRSYLTGLFGSFHGERDDLALAILAGSPEGRHRGRQWLDDPALCHDEAVASMTILRARANAYRDAARNQRVA